MIKTDEIKSPFEKLKTETDIGSKYLYYNILTLTGIT